MPFTRTICTALLASAAVTCTQPVAQPEATKPPSTEQIEAVRHLKVTFGIEGTIYHPPPDLALRER